MLCGGAAIEIDGCSEHGELTYPSGPLILQ